MKTKNSIALIALSLISLLVSFSAISKRNPSDNSLATVFNGGKKLVFTLGNITTQPFDQNKKNAIVSAANKYLQYQGAGGVAGTIGNAAGTQRLRSLFAAGRVYGLDNSGQAIYCPAGRVKISPGYNLEIKNIHFIIHAVGPDCRIKEENQDKKQLLTDAYTDSFSQARFHKINTIAFPSISTGIFGYPLADATKIAVQVAIDQLNSPDNDDLKEVRFVLFDQKTLEMYKKTFDTIEAAKHSWFARLKQLIFGN